MLKMNFSLSKTHNPLTISERFLLIRKEFSLTAGRLGEIAGVTGTAIAKIESGDTVNPKADVLSRISTKLQINLNWLLLGEGDMLKPGISSKTSDIHYQPAEGDLVPKNGQDILLLVDEPEMLIHLSHQEKIIAALEKKGAVAPFDAHAIGLLSEFPVVELPLVSFKARASFVELGGADVSAGNFERVLHRCGIDEHGNQRTPADYTDAIVFEVDGDSMIPSMQSGQKVIAWPIPESKWEHLHNTACVVAYDDTVTVKAILENDLFVNNRLTLRATKPGGGYFVVGRASIHSIWEVREFFGVVPYRLFQ